MWMTMRTLLRNSLSIDSEFNIVFGPIWLPVVPGFGHSEAGASTPMQAIPMGLPSAGMTRQNAGAAFHLAFSLS